MPELQKSINCSTTQVSISSGVGGCHQPDMSLRHDATRICHKGINCEEFHAPCLTVWCLRLWVGIGCGCTAVVALLLIELWKLT